ncbi:PIN-like domain-containing protein [Streptomyces anulatus]
MEDEEAHSGPSSEVPSRGLFDGFSGYVTPTEDNWKDVLGSGMVVVDTNVLLNLYRYNQDARDSLLSALHKFGDRLWVPNQVMGEFWRNRESALEDPGKQLNQSATALRADLQKAVSDLRNWVNRVSLDRPNAMKLESTLARAFDEVIAKMEAVVDSSGTEMAQDTTKDAVISALAELLSGKVGGQLNAADHASAVVEGKRRIQEEIPPGYKDKKKQGRGDDTEVGDYLVWVQVILEAQKRGNDVLLVTGDAKEDWWRIKNGMTLGPRNELAEELLSEAKVRLYMLKPDRLLTYARDFLHVEVTEGSVQNVEMVDAQSTTDATFAVLEGLADVDATGAMLGAWREIQKALIKALPHDSSGRGRSSTIARLRELEQLGITPGEVLQSIRNLQQMRNSIVHKDDVELTLEGARSFISSAKVAVEALAISSTPQAQAQQFENAISDLMREAGFSVSGITEEGGDPGYDFRVTYRSQVDRFVAVQAKYISNGAFDEKSLERERERLKKLSDAAASVLVVTNAPLVDAVREFNLTSAENEFPMEVVQRRSSEDDHLVIRALMRVMR